MEQQLQVAFANLEDLKKKFVGSGEDHDRFRGTINYLANTVKALLERAAAASGAPAPALVADATQAEGAPIYPEAAKATKKK